MQNLKQDNNKLSHNFLAKLLYRQQSLSNFRQNNRLEPKKQLILWSNKRHLRADVLSLLSSALRPRLLGNRGEKSYNVAKIVALSTILSVSGLFSFISSTSVFADSLTLTIPSSPLSLDLNPTVNNGFATTSSSFSIKTDNSSGYTVSIKSKNESGDNSLINGNNKLLSISSAISEDTFKNGSEYINMWGWSPNKLNSEDNTNYQIAPGTEEVVLDNTEEANEAGQNYSISLGAKVAIDSVSGTYNNNFIISVTANKLKLPTLQDWNGCNELVEDGETYVTLQDSRDSNIYNVAKLKDGKCWMLEDLKLGGEREKTLTPDNSDITNEYILPTVDQDDFGNLYTYNVATANTGGDFTPEGQNAPGSICPKGWRLPVGAPGNEFDIMANSYASSGSLVAAPIPHFSLGYYFSSTSKGLLSYAAYYPEAYSFGIRDDSFGITATEQFGVQHIRCISRDINEKPYDIFFDSNRSGTSGTDVTPQHQAGYTVDNTIKISSAQPTHANGDFIGWCTSNPGLRDECPGQTYQPNTEYPLNNGRSITLYAIWKINKIYSNIYYNLNGGSASGLSRDYFTVTSSSPAKINSKVPTKSNYQFMGWCDEDNSADMSSCPGNMLSTGEVLPLSFYLNRGSSSLYLYAIWERV